MEDSRHKYAWLNWGVRLLPFTDAVSEDLPLSRLLRLSLFQISVGMALVLLVGTLNRVMIVELGVPTSLVAVMVGMPLYWVSMSASVGLVLFQLAPARMLPLRTLGVVPPLVCSVRTERGDVLSCAPPEVCVLAEVVLSGKKESNDFPVAA